MKIAATWFREGRGLAIGLLVAALTVGSAAPHLIRGLTDLPWRHTLFAASVAAALGAARGHARRARGRIRFPPARFDLRMAVAVLRERGPRLACFGYFGHMWELYAMWAWLATFLAASLEARGGGSYAGLNASAATFVCAGLAGGLGAWAGGALADRWGRTTLTMAAMAVSGLCAVADRPHLRRPAAADPRCVAGSGASRSIADSAQFSTAVTELAPAAYVGTALTTQTCLGFALTMVSIWLIPPAVAWSAGAGRSPCWRSGPPWGWSPWRGCGPCPRPGSWRAAGAEAFVSRAHPAASAGHHRGQEAITMKTIKALGLVAAVIMALWPTTMPAPAAAVSAPSGIDSRIRLDWEAGPGAGASRRSRATSTTTTAARPTDVHLLVETLDASGAVIATDHRLRAGRRPVQRRVYFEVPLKTTGAAYRVTVTSFDWKGGGGGG